MIPPAARVAHSPCPWCGATDARAVRPTDDGRWWKRALLALTSSAPPVTTCCARPVDFDVEVTRGLVLVTYTRPKENR